MDQDVFTVEDLTAEEAQVILFKTDRQRQRDDGQRSPALMAVITGPPVDFWYRPMTRIYRRIRS